MLLQKSYLLLRVLLLVLTAGVHASSIPVDSHYLKEGEASSGWHGLYPIIDDFLKTLRAGNGEKAYYTYTTEGLQAQTPLKEFLKLVDENPVLKNNKLYSFQSFYFDNGIAIFQGALISNRGDSLQTEFDLKPVGSSWKIDGIHLFKPEMITPPRKKSTNLPRGTQRKPNEPLNYENCYGLPSRQRAGFPQKCRHAPHH